MSPSLQEVSLELFHRLKPKPRWNKVIKKISKKYGQKFFCQKLPKLFIFTSFYVVLHSKALMQERIQSGVIKNAIDPKITFFDVLVPSEIFSAQLKIVSTLNIVTLVLRLSHIFFPETSSNTNENSAKKDRKISAIMVFLAEIF